MIPHLTLSDARNAFRLAFPGILQHRISGWGKLSSYRRISALEAPPGMPIYAWLPLPPMKQIDRTN